MNKKDKIDEANKITRMLVSLLNQQLRGKPIDDIFTIGSISISALSAQFCFVIIENSYPEEAIKLLDNIYEEAKNILKSLYPTGTTQ